MQCKPWRPRSLAALSFVLCGFALLCGAWPAAAFDVAVDADHKSIESGEHPRLIFRGDEALAALKEEAKSEWGKGVVHRLHQSLKLMDKAPLIGRNREVVKEAGFRAAGYGSVYQMTGEAKAAYTAADILMREVVNYPLKAQVETVDLATHLHGAALTYDLAYDGWDAETRQKVRDFLLAESADLVRKVGGVDGVRPNSDVPVMVIASAGLAELAVLKDKHDGEALKRIEAYEKAVLKYLDEGVSDQGFGVVGESVKQAAFASGVVPFAIANKLVLGRDITDHPAIRNAMVPMVYQTVPGAGMPVVGPATAAVDRTGLFAMCVPLAPKQQRPGIVWTFEQVGGRKYFGVVRPHHALYALSSGIGEIEAAAPGGETWPSLLRDDRAGVALYRSRWRDDDDLVVMLHDGQLRVIGMGDRWAATAGPHAGMWSDSPGAGRLDNVFLYQTQFVKKTNTHRLSAQHALRSMESDEAAGLMTIAFDVKGKVTRTKQTVEKQERVDGKRQKIKVEVPEGGAFTGSRVLGVDTSGKCGAPLLMVVADELKGADQVQREWVMHLGPRPQSSQDMWGRRVPSHWTLGDTFIKQSGELSYYDAPDLTEEQARDKDAKDLPPVQPIFGAQVVTMRGQALLPSDATFAGTSNAPHANFVHLPTMSRTAHVIITIGPGEPPKIQAGDKGLAEPVKVGKRTVQLVDGKIVFSD